MKKSQIRVTLLLTLALLFSLPINADEFQLSPFEGSTLTGEHNSRFSSLPVLTEPMDAQNAPIRIDVEGSLNSRIYQRPAEVSPLEIVRSYSKALIADGFELLLVCEKAKNNCKK